MDFEVRGQFCVGLVDFNNKIRGFLKLHRALFKAVRVVRLCQSPVSLLDLRPLAARIDTQDSILLVPVGVVV